MEHFLTVEFLGVLVLAIVVSGIVSLLALRKTIGYGKAFILTLGLTLLLIFVRIPFPIWISAAMCSATFLAWPKRDVAAEAKN